jgi:hypothetical protein
MPFVWPEKEAFQSTFACRFLPRAGKTKFPNVIFGPVFNLIDFSKPMVWAVSVGLLFVSWLMVHTVLPIGFWNSTDGQYIDGTRAAIFSFVLYYILSAVLIGFLNTSGCNSLEEQAEAYLYTAPAALPSTLRES